MDARIDQQDHTEDEDMKYTYVTTVRTNVKVETPWEPIYIALDDVKDPQDDQILDAIRSLIVEIRWNAISHRWDVFSGSPKLALRLLFSCSKTTFSMGMRNRLDEDSTDVRWAVDKLIRMVANYTATTSYHLKGRDGVVCTTAAIWRYIANNIDNRTVFPESWNLAHIKGEAVRKVCPELYNDLASSYFCPCCAIYHRPSSPSGCPGCPGIGLWGGHCEKLSSPYWDFRHVVHSFTNMEFKDRRAAAKTSAEEIATYFEKLAC